jgi:DNA-binding LacI/PurR family transcriptional regulator
LRDLGRRGFENAVRAVAGEPLRPEVLPTQIILRDTTAPPAQRGSQAA